MPKSFKPELATLVKEAPQGDLWLHEIKYDGYRILAFIENKQVRLISRNGQDWTKKFLTIAEAIHKWSLKATLFDGELVVLNEQRHSDFQRLQNGLTQKGPINLHYFVFDLPFYNGQSLVNKPLLERKKILESIMNAHDTSTIHYSPHIIGQGEKVFRNACQQKLEGIISKKVDAHYYQARTEDWLKVKCAQRQEFLIIGFTDPQGARQYFGSLLLGYRDQNQQLIYCGHVGTGFTSISLKYLYDKLVPLQQNEIPLAKKPPRRMQNKTHWVKPQLIAEVEFIAWTEDGYLRHPSFKGLREDKSTAEIKKEKIKTLLTSNPKISHPTKVLYPAVHITKQEVVHYFTEVADYLLPHVHNRPLTLVRCPMNVKNKCFYQKNWTESLPQEWTPIEVETSSGRAQFIRISTKEGLIAAAQLDVLEIHPWGSCYDQLDVPDRLIFDLDPSPEVKWSQLSSAALLVKEALKALHLKSFVKLTGGKGVHIVVPIHRTKTFKAVKQWAKIFSEQLVLNFPKIFTIQLKKQARAQKIFIDYLRNDYGSTAIAPFSLRARETATIAVPISWEKLSHMKKIQNYTLLTWHEYQREFSKDPWENFFTLHQKIPWELFNL